jgi:predicted DNA-binding transcriptional regulator AlpA
MKPSNSSAGRVGQLTHSVASLVANPCSASEVPVDRIPALVAELASEQSALSALQDALTTRLLVSQANAAAQPEPSDRLLTAEEVATTLGVTKRWVQRRARRLPFARRISDHAIRCSESGLRRWMLNRKLSAA